MPRLRYVAVGRLGKPHGVRGEVRVDPRGGLPRGLEGYRRFLLGRGEDLRPAEVETYRPHGRLLLVKFAGIDSPEAAQALSQQVLYVPREDLPPLEPGEYYYADLIGCRVRGEAGEELGRVADVFPSGASDVLVVEWEGGEWMLPVVSEFVLEVNPDEGEVTTRRTEGLRE